eukprot:5650344-Pleurochrysis_carterae.AAC.1
MDDLAKRHKYAERRSVRARTRIIVTASEHTTSRPPSRIHGSPSQEALGIPPEALGDVRGRRFGRSSAPPSAPHPAIVTRSPVATAASQRV